MALDMTSFDPMLKDHYSPLPVANMAYQKNKALGMLNKSSKRPGGGRKWVQPIQFGLPGGGSSTFATAMAATNNNSQYEAWEVTRTKHYRKAQVDNETIEATADGDMDAFEPAFDEFDKGIESEANYLNFRFFRGKNGSIARMTNTVFTTAVMTLDDAAGTWGVRKDDVVQLSADGITPRAGSLTVLSVQRSAGTITFTGTIVAGVAAAATNDFVSLTGDIALAASGLEDWLPATAPAATAFFGVDRTTEPEMLGGLRVDGTDGRPIHELLIDMTVQVDNMGWDPDIVFMNPRNAGTLTKQLEGKWIISQPSTSSGKKIASIGYRGWQVNLEGHEVTIFTDRCCQVNRVWELTWESIVMFAAGMAPNFLQKRAGSIIKVSESSDAYEARIGEYYNYCVKGPGCNVNGQTP